jgi:uncharacterized membrane protein
MNIPLGILQSLLAVHTLIGGIWKFSNSEQTVPGLKAIPHGVWLAIGVLELLCALGLILPVLIKPVARLAPIAAACIAAEMLLFSALQIYSGDPEFGHIVYWLVVAALCVFIGYFRVVLRPTSLACQTVPTAPSAVK